MLHALIGGKLDPTLPELQRREDALTSTIFGTLALVEAWDVIGLWLGAEFESASAESTPECWFWPRLAGGVEPDVMLRLGDLLLVVEAKYRSGRHDLTVDEQDDERPVDQIVRQHQAVSPPHDLRSPYPEALEGAVRQCRIAQAFLVDARRIRRARREFEESKALLPPAAALNLATWQTLYRILLDSRWSTRRWAGDLRAYLTLAGLATFHGIDRRLSETEHLAGILKWNAFSRRQVAPGLRSAAETLVDQPAIADLARWRVASRFRSSGDRP